MNVKQKAKLKEAIEKIDRILEENTKFNRSENELIKFCGDMIDLKFLIYRVICNSTED